MRVKMIWAQSSNGYIGHNGKLLFQIPEDLKRFKEMTEGHVVIMGRKTWESLPEKVKPLPNRINMVLTRNKNIKFPENVYSLFDLQALIATARILNQEQLESKEIEKSRDIWIIGGESVYQEGLQFADEIHVTNIRQSFLGDARAPVIPSSTFDRISVSSLNSHRDLQYQFITYYRRP